MTWIDGRLFKNHPIKTLAPINVHSSFNRICSRRDLQLRLTNPCEQIFRSFNRTLKASIRLENQVQRAEGFGGNQLDCRTRQVIENSRYMTPSLTIDIPKTASD